MRTRSAAGLLVVAGAAGFSGHLLGGNAVAAKPALPRPPVLAVPIPPELPVRPAQRTHILWMFVQGRWRAVPA